MKWIIAAGTATLLFCSGSAAHAQPATAPATTTQQVTVDADMGASMVKKMSPQDRENLVLMWKHLQRPNETADQQKQEKDAYENMSPDDQLKLAEQAGDAIYQSSGKPTGTVKMVPLDKATVMKQPNGTPQQ